MDPEPDVKAHLHVAPFPSSVPWVIPAVMVVVGERHQELRKVMELGRAEQHLPWHPGAFLSPFHKEVRCLQTKTGV